MPSKHGDEVDRRKLIRVDLPRSSSRFLEQEKRRLQDSYGLKVTVNEIIQALIERHKMNMKMKATDDNDSVEWYYRYMAEK